MKLYVCFWGLKLISILNWVKRFSSFGFFLKFMKRYNVILSILHYAWDSFVVYCASFNRKILKISFKHSWIHYSKYIKQLNHQLTVIWYFTQSIFFSCWKGKKLRKISLHDSEQMCACTLHEVLFLVLRQELRYSWF